MPYSENVRQQTTISLHVRTALSLIATKADTIYHFARFQKKFCPSYDIENSKNTPMQIQMRGLYHNELPHLDLHCVIIQILSFLIATVEKLYPATNILKVHTQN